MKRYNQGFGKFGPMEQCKDGEWVKYWDAIKYFDKTNNKYAKDISLMNKLILEEKEEADFYRFVSAISLSINAGFIISEIINKFFL